MGLVSDHDAADVVALLGRDIEATIGPDYLDLVREAARRQRQFVEERDTYIARVVDDVQQHVHDLFIDTTWPACPRHPNHPMWFENGWWVADGRPLAPLGGLGDLLQ